MGGHVFGKSSKVLAGTLAVGCATVGLGVLRAAPTAAADSGAVPAHHRSASAVPTITSLSETVGPASGGNRVIIAGNDLAEAFEIDFGGAPVPTHEFACTAHECRVHSVPQGTPGATVDVTVTTLDGTSNALSYSYRAVATGVPTVTGMSSHVGPPGGGNMIAIFGTNLADVTAMQFGAVVVSPRSFICDTAGTTCTVTVPAGLSPQTVDVTVTNTFGTSATSANDLYTYRPDSPPAPPVPPRPVGPVHHRDDDRPVNNGNGNRGEGDRSDNNNGNGNLGGHDGARLAARTGKCQQDIPQCHLKN